METTEMSYDKSKNDIDYETEGNEKKREKICLRVAPNVMEAMVSFVSLSA